MLKDESCSHKHFIGDHPRYGAALRRSCPATCNVGCSGKNVDTKPVLGGKSAGQGMALSSEQDDDDDTDRASVMEACEDSSTACAGVKSQCMNSRVGRSIQAMCPFTCGLCTPSTTKTSKKTPSQPQKKKSGVAAGNGKQPPATKPSSPADSCYDIATSCAHSVAWCNDPIHGAAMRKNCARTCAVCTPANGGSSRPVPTKPTRPAPINKPKPGSSRPYDSKSATQKKPTPINNTAAKKKPVVVASSSKTSNQSASSDPNCMDTASTCAQSVAYCQHERFASSMRATCRKTCRFC